MLMEFCFLEVFSKRDEANSEGDNGSMKFWDWNSAYNYQSMDIIIQPGSLSSEAGIFASTFDMTGLRLITGNADKTIHIYGQDDEAVSTPPTNF